MKKLGQIFKNKEIIDRIFFTLMILLVFRIGASIAVPGVKVVGDWSDSDALSMMNLLGGGALSSFSIFALGVSPYITSQIIVQLLSMDVLPALSELNKQGQYGRKKIEMATRYLTLLLGAVQAYGIIKTMQATDYIEVSTIANSEFFTYVYIVTVLVSGGMLVMWLGDQISVKGIGNGISVIIFAGIVVSLPTQILQAFSMYLSASIPTGDAALILSGSFRFLLYILAYIAIITFVIFIESSKRKIPVQHAGKSGGGQKYSQASFLPIKINSAGVIPVIFASSIMMAPQVIVSFIDGADTSAEWLNIFSNSKMTTIGNFQFPFGLVIYITLIIAFTFFYSSLQINPEQMAENFQKNGSYIPGIRPGNETERYVRRVLNRVTFIGAIALALIAALPVVLVLTGLLPQSLALGGTGLIIVVGVAIEVSTQIDGLVAGKSFEEVQRRGAE
ncbi:MAG: preprotein translocase subunit SecY [Erysipelotrichales bacterium]|nr:preprotein translocase subunit SecY [Erysipelotrichales bacterium]